MTLIRIYRPMVREPEARVAPAEPGASRAVTMIGRVRAGARAFTLIEMVMVLVILSFIGLVTINYIVSVSRMYALLLAQQQADNEAGDLVKRMRREARTVAFTFTADSTVWSFCNRQGHTNTFQLSGSEVLLNGNCLAQNARVFRLTYYDALHVRLTPLPLSATDRALINRVTLELQVTNDLTVAEAQVNFFLLNDIIK